MALIVFPFISSPILRNLGEIKPQEFTALMQERKKYLSKWVLAMMKVK
jgi:hypothetical protein